MGGGFGKICDGGVESVREMELFFWVGYLLFGGLVWGKYDR